MPSTATFEKQFVYLDDPKARLGKGQIALVSGVDVPILELDLPDGLRGQAREQVARRQLLDRIGLNHEAIEMRPFASSETGQWSRVFVTDSVKLSGWRNGEGAKARAVLPDYLGLATAPDLWTIAQRGFVSIVRLGPDDGFSAPSTLAMAILSKRLKNNAPKPKAILYTGEPDPVLNLISDEFDLPIVKNIDDLANLDVAKPEILGHGEIAMNLLRDPQMARSRLQRRVLPWRWPLLFSTIAVGLWATSEIILTNRLEAQVRVVQRETLALVKTHFVPNGPILDVRSQVSRQLTSLRNATGSDAVTLATLDLFAQASSVIMGSGAQIETVSALNNDTVTLVLRVENFGAADQVLADLASAGLQAEIVESLVSEAADGVRTEIRLTGRLIEGQE